MYRIKLQCHNTYELQYKFLGLFWCNCSMNAYSKEYALEKLGKLMAKNQKPYKQIRRMTLNDH